jgi:L-ascorbate metabolism protein UlaG (beta-lactamase superfamily)
MRTLITTLFLLVSSTASAKNDIGITWLGHATFEVVSPGGTRLLIDPFIKGNPATPAKMKDLSKYKPNAILVSHSHPDHASDAVEIAKASGAKVISVFEWVAAQGIDEGQKLGGNVGGFFTVGDVTVSMVPAMHSNEPSGRPVGFVITFKDGRSIYHTGDTWIFGDMALIQKIYQPAIILLQAGGGPYNQDPKVAAMAVNDYFKPETIIPMHYGTFPVLADEAAVKAAFGNDTRLKIMKPGDSIKL